MKHYLNYITGSIVFLAGWQILGLSEILKTPLCNKIDNLLVLNAAEGGETKFVKKSDLIGKVIHYYDKIGVAVIDLKKSLKVGDKIKFVRGENIVEQQVESMQLEHIQVPTGKKGQEIAIKVDEKVGSGTLVYLA